MNEVETQIALQNIDKGKSSWLVIPELNIIVETEIHHKNKTYVEFEKDCPKDWQIMTYPILQWLRNSKYAKKLNLIETYEFVENPDLISKALGKVASFYAYSDYSDWASLYCSGGPRGSYSGLGVRYFKRFKKNNKYDL